MLSRNSARKTYINNFTATLPSNHTSNRGKDDLKPLDKNVSRSKNRAKYL